MIDARQNTLEDLLKLISGDGMVQWKSVLLMASSNLLSGHLEGNLQMLESFKMDWGWGNRIRGS